MVQALATDERLRRFTRVEYERLVGEGWFRDERIELLRGMLVELSPQKAPHAAAVQNLNHLLVLALVPSGRAAVRVQLPFAAGPDSEPEPDVAVVPARSYQQEHPSSAYLIIEVADSSYSKDSVMKAEVYAEAAVPEYWVVDVVNQRVDVQRVPVGGRYTEQSAAGRSDALRLLAFEDVVVPVASLFV